jgi:sigma-E factor negative regulatory protein RseC
MLESEALVVKIENGATFVEAQAITGCGGNRCESQGCSTAVLTRLFSQQPKALQVNNPIDALVGEHVVVGLEEGAFLKSSVVAYVLPLTALITGAVLGTHFAGASEMRDLYAGFGGVIGLISSALAIKFFLPTIFTRGVQPIILRRL